MANRNAIQEIKDRLDILSIVERYVPLQRVGSRYRGPCPFHHETKPSFYIDPDLGLYHCFGCNASGDIIDFYCKVNGLEFYEGLKELAEEVGIDIGSLKRGKSRPSKRKTFLEINSIALDFFKRSLREHKEAMEYLIKREIPSFLIEEFGLGYSPNSWDSLKNYLIQKGYSVMDGVDAGVLVRNEKGSIYDRFRARIIFPIYDVGGRCIGFGGRIIGDGEPKYLNTSENSLFKKGENLYGLYQARREISLRKFAILTEGYIDVIRLHQFGYKNSCGVLGTALSMDHVKKLSNLCSKVVLIFDGDDAGRKAALRSTQLFLSHGTEVEVVELPEGEDVDTYLKKYGNNGLDSLMKNAKKGLAFCAAMIKLNSSPREVIKWCRDFVLSLEDSALLSFYLPLLSKEFGISEFELTRHIKREKKIPSGNLRHPSFSIGDKEILQFAICFPDYVEKLNEMGAGKCLNKDFSKKLWEKLTAYPVEELLYNLDEAERAFYVKALFFKEKISDPRRVWGELCAFLKKKKIEREIRRAKEGLARAQIMGSKKEMEFYLSQINQLIKGGQ